MIVRSETLRRIVRRIIASILLALAAELGGRRVRRR